MRKLIAVFWGMVALSLVTGCGLLDSDATVRISLPTMSFEFSVDLADTRSLLEAQIGQDLGELEIIPEPIDFQGSFELETPPYKQDLSSQEKLKAYIDAGHIKSVKIKFVRYHILTNTLNYDVPVINVYTGDYEITDSSQATKIAVIPEIKIDYVGQGEVQFTTNGRDTLTEQVMSLKFALIGMFGIEVDTDVNRSIPDGELSGKVEIGLEFTVDPL